MAGSVAIAPINATVRPFSFTHRRILHLGWYRVFMSGRLSVATGDAPATSNRRPAVQVRASLGIGPTALGHTSLPGRHCPSSSSSPPVPSLEPRPNESPPMPQARSSMPMEPPFPPLGSATWTLRDEGLHGGGAMGDPGGLPPRRHGRHVRQRGGGRRGREGLAACRATRSSSPRRSGTATSGRPTFAARPRRACARSGSTMSICS